MKKQSINYPRNSRQAELNKRKVTLLDQGWNEEDRDYMDRLKKMLLDSQGYIDKLHKTVYNKNGQINEMQNHIFFLEDELHALSNEQNLNTVSFDEAV